jgi:hypothetical protein
MDFNDEFWSPIPQGSQNDTFPAPSSASTIPNNVFMDTNMTTMNPLPQRPSHLNFSNASQRGCYVTQRLPRCRNQLKRPSKEKRASESSALHPICIAKSLRNIQELRNLLGSQSCPHPPNISMCAIITIANTCKMA